MMSYLTILSKCRKLCIFSGSVWMYPGRHRVGRVLSFFSSRRNWDSPPPLAAGECAPPTLWSGGEGTLACGLRGGGVPIPTRGHTLWCSINISTLWLWRKNCLTSPPSPTLLASWEIADRHPSQTICPTRDSCHVLIEIAGQPGTDFSHRGERSILYTVYNTMYKQLAGSFWVLQQNLQQVAPNQEKPHTTPLHSLICSIYISVYQTLDTDTESGSALNQCGSETLVGKATHWAASCQPI